MSYKDTKAVVLLSGGQDSTTALFWARLQFDELHCVSVDYGQRHVRELEAAQKIAERAGAKTHVTLDLPALSQIGDSALVSADDEITGDGGYADHADGGPGAAGLPTSYVPGRNLLLLSMAAAVATKVGAHDVVTGVCQTDFSGYPDCRRSFVDALEGTLVQAMPTQALPLRILTPLMHLDKAQTVRLAQRLPGCMDALALSHTCYQDVERGCGTCPACELRIKGFAEAGVVDPMRGE